MRPPRRLTNSVYMHISHPRLAVSKDVTFPLSISLHSHNVYMTIIHWSWTWWKDLVITAADSSAAPMYLKDKVRKNLAHWPKFTFQTLTLSYTGLHSPSCTMEDRHAKGGGNSTALKVKRPGIYPELGVWTWTCPMTFLGLSFLFLKI